MKRVAVIVLTLSAAVTWSIRGSSQTPTPSGNWSVSVTPVASPAASESAQPQLSALGNRVVLSWVERSGDTATLRFSDRTDTGWTAPQTVASSPR